MKEERVLNETVIRAGDIQPLKTYLQDLWRYRMLLWVFTARDIKVRYSQTVLGFSWIVLSPLITVGVFTFVFGFMIKIPTDGLPYILFYLVAIIPWYAFMAMINLTMGSVEGNAGLVSKIYFPRLLLGGTYTLSSGVDYLVGFCLIIICAIIYHKLSIQLLILFPFLFLIQAMFAMGLGLMMAPFSTRYRDIKLFVPLALQLYYFANPILYPISASPKWLRFWYEFNPMSMVICGYREALNGRWPNPEQFLFGFLAAIAVFVIGFSIFRKHEQSLVDAI
ncbi:TPA: ABC transporter permease [Legionella pneumophila]|uniref:Transport permease protein n=2 Tax=Legionella pneumophila TaxID=446 RepID=T2AT37_LEGPN|nr:ABC transporter permease [Legionella pneumophila]HAT8912870.1 ABC transporter [Legionella pneumophila subsp. pneumophila]AGU99411.1 WZM [Legionella pneumophila]ALK48479.1 Wzm [Legionella pneumophila subsp. pneumophila ATCC 33215]MCK0183362.1 ABC transporter permease [Legionella pneumophila]MCK1880911.1 ABC transporter permease [Legionella pneumophila]